MRFKVARTRLKTLYLVGTGQSFSAMSMKQEPHGPGARAPEGGLLPIHLPVWLESFNDLVIKTTGCAPMHKDSYT